MAGQRTAKAKTEKAGAIDVGPPGDDATDTPSGDVVAVTLRRRSVRTGFSGVPPSDDVLTTIVRCGLSAPASKNAGPTRLQVVRDRELLEHLAVLTETAEGVDAFVPHDPTTGLPRPDWPSTVAESAAALRAAPCAIFIENVGPFTGGRRTLLGLGYQAIERCFIGYTLEVLSVGASLQSMWLAAVALGLQAAFLGDILVAEDTIRERLGMSGDLVGALLIGHAAPTAVPPPRPVEPTADRVTWR